MPVQVFFVRNAISTRTSIVIVGLGFVVARFALGGKSVSGLSTAFGVALVLCGGALLVLALRFYLRVGEASPTESSATRAHERLRQSP